MVGDHGHQEAARAVVPTKLVLGPEPGLRADRPVSVCTRHAIEATASRRDSRAAPRLQQHAASTMAASAEHAPWSSCKWRSRAASPSSAAL